MEQSAKSNTLVVGVDDKISAGKAFLLGLQHVLAMDLYIAPIIIAGLLSLNATDTSFFIQMCFIGTGIATLIQTGFGLRLPVVQGPSYVPIGAMGAIGSKLGLGAMTGSLIPGALLMMLLGMPLKWFAKAVRRMIPPLVGGTVILIVGISLMPTGMNNIYRAEGNLWTNILIAAVSAGVLIICMLLGRQSKKLGTVSRLISVIVAIVAGTLFASMFGKVDFSRVAEADAFSIPSFFPFGAPEFNLSAIVTMMFVYFIILIETTGTWFVISSITGKELTDERLNRAAAGEGLGCFVGSLFGGTPMTGYSSNAGLIAVTGVGSRMAIMAGGGILIALGLMPKLSAAITCIPEPVINGIFGVVCVAIVVNGLKVIQFVDLDERAMMIIGVPILLTMAVTVLPDGALKGLPDFAVYVLSSGITVGALAALILNLVIPSGKHKAAAEGTLVASGGEQTAS
ncbi:purine permease [Paenibacillus alvei]|uniref:Purine permease n=1 Tax=Paenibacillus alvei TaxID=44250 RepID=A0ABT4GSK1_PAEAL|nr:MULTISPECIES: nucleobase:cation symporter-2 family protein [Paenibacillus]EJW18568.1 uric acid permease PucK [Paenibacillus alvei DSM 29]MCY7485100.1 purine permease [Paenibacillus alvei]MCY9539732.1 purine permease [Paenibacillus alvei]MCY9703255.1 purine permease [Paenibacillus alvei]MCY9735525.1 purine permease [Paenibacillus alvei]